MYRYFVWVGLNGILTAICMCHNKLFSFHLERDTGVWIKLHFMCGSLYRLVNADDIRKNKNI